MHIMPLGSKLIFLRLCQPARPFSQHAYIYKKNMFLSWLILRMPFTCNMSFALFSNNYLLTCQNSCVSCWHDISIFVVLNCLSYFFFIYFFYLHAHGFNKLFTISKLLAFVNSIVLQCLAFRCKILYISLEGNKQAIKIN